MNQLDTEPPGHPPPAIYGAIAAVAGSIARHGIAKDRRNSQQGYNFRGIDDVYNALAPHLADAGLVILPRVLSRLQTERETKNGGALFNVVVEVEFDFVAAADGSRHTVKTFGEAMDSADKATNKAMSAAYKYAAMQAFCIPTAGDNDADATSHDVAPRRQATARRQPTPAAAPAQQPASPALVAQAQAAADGAGFTSEGLESWLEEISSGNASSLAQLPAEWLQKLISKGVHPDVVARHNAAAAPAELPATWQQPAAQPQSEPTA